MATQRLMWQAFGVLSAAISGALTRMLLKAVWRRFKGGDPPDDPAAPTTTWSEAITWAAASGVAMAVGRLVAQKGLAEAWKAKTGSYPEALEPTSS